MSLTSSPRLVKGGLVVLDAATGAVKRTIALQYNPDTLTRSYQVQGVGGEGGGERAQPFRLEGAGDRDRSSSRPRSTPPTRSSIPTRTPTRCGSASRRSSPCSRRWSIRASPSCRRWTRCRRQGTLEILPPEAPLVLFVWSASRVVPVRVTEFSITEEAFDPSLNPMRAKVSLGLRVMSTDDLGFDHRGGSVFISHLRAREALAGKSGAASLQTLGLTSLPCKRRRTR